MTDFVARHQLVSPHPGIAFAGVFTAFVAVAVALAAALPLELSIGIVWLLAGPHNLMEARYMLGRLPARVGRLRPFFLVAAGGALLLGGSFAALPWAAATFDGRPLQALWNALVLLWIATLVVMRSQTRPRFDASLVPPVALLVAVLQWPCPCLLGLVLVFGHPLVAIAVLDRELRRLHRHWLPTWRIARLAVPLGACAVWLLTGLGGELAVRSSIEQSIVRHAGVELLPFAPARSLVALHAFLELIHYGVWIAILPWLGRQLPPWRIDNLPLVRRGHRWKLAVAAGLACAGMAVAVLWACFWIDYHTTRHVYFTIAVFHVLAEIPFYLRLPLTR